MLEEHADDLRDRRVTVPAQARRAQEPVPPCEGLEGSIRGPDMRVLCKWTEELVLELLEERGLGALQCRVVRVEAETVLDDDHLTADVALLLQPVGIDEIALG